MSIDEAYAKLAQILQKPEAEVRQNVAQQAAAKGVEPVMMLQELLRLLMAPPQAQKAQAPPVNYNPEVAMAISNFLKKQNLKSRTCILGDKRRDMFKAKRALRALQSPEYEKARKKNPLLPEINGPDSLKKAFSHLPALGFAIAVAKIDDETPKNKKRVKGLWKVKPIKADVKDDTYYIWAYEGSQVMQRVYAALAIVAVFTIVLFPLWPMKMRQGVWYLSMGMLGLIGLFFAMSIFRLILFVITMFAVPPGLWLYPNLFEDVGFFDSFRPLWGWQEEKKKGKKPKKAKSSSGPATQMPGQPAPAQATTTSAAPVATAVPTQRHQAPRVEEVEDE